MSFTIRPKQHPGVTTPTYYVFDLDIGLSAPVEFFDSASEAEAYIFTTLAARARARKSFREE